MSVLFRGRSLASRLGTAGLAVSVCVGVVAVDVTAGPALRAAAAVTELSAPSISEAPDAASAALAAKAQGRPVEVLAARSETETVMANPDGTFTSDVAAAPVRVRRNNAWTPVDTTLTNDAGVIQPKAGALDVRLSAGGTGGFASVLGKDSRGRATSLGLGDGRALPVPILSGSTARYVDAVPGADLLLRVGAASVSHDFVIKSRAGALSSYRLPLTLSGLSPRVTADGGVELIDAQGKAQFAAPKPMMWDNSVNPASGLSDHVGAVTASVDSSGTTPVLVLTPDAKFLADPAVTFPVTVDPTYTATANVYADTWVDNNAYQTSQNSSPDLRTGTYNGGASSVVARSFLNFPITTFAGTQVTSATLRLRNWYAQTCSGTNVLINQITHAWSSIDITWANQPPVTTAGMGAAAGAFGFSSSCPEADVNYNVTAIAQAWAATPSTNYGFRISSSLENDTRGWRRFRSTSYLGGAASVAPHLIVNYDSYPRAASGLFHGPLGSFTDGTGATTLYTRSTRPTMSAVVSDPDGGVLHGVFGMLQNGSVVSGLGGQVGSDASSGARSYFTVPAGYPLSDGQTYTMRVTGNDGTLSSQGTAPTRTFTVDVSPPTAPTIASPSYPSGAWGNGVGQFTFASGDAVSKVRTYLYSLDTPTPSTALPDGASTLNLNPPPDGKHVMYVRSVDYAGNLSTISQYAFGAGAAVAGPADGTVTARSVPLGGITAPNQTAVTFYYRRAAADQWTPIPPSDVTRSGTALTSWPLVLTPSDTTPTTGAGSSTVVPSLAWDLSTTVKQQDGPVQVKVCFGSTCPTTATSSFSAGLLVSLTPVTATLDQQSFDTAATASLSGVGVNLLNGNAQMSATDVSVSGSQDTTLTLGRTLNTRTAAATTGIFGPGWTASLPDKGAGVDYTSLSDGGSVLTLTSSDQSTTALAQTAGGTGVWRATGSDTDSGLSMSAVSSGCDTGFRCLQLQDLAGNITLFQSTQPTTAVGTPTAPVPFQVRSVTEVGNTAATTYNYSGSQVTRILSPTPTSGCASWVVGCRSLDLTYGTSGGSASKLTAVTYSTTDSSGALLQIDVACYGYNASGQLTDQWDPRNITTAGSGTHPITCNPAAPVRPTHYIYQASGSVSTIIPAYSTPNYTLAPINLGFDGNGRLTSVSRTHLGTGGGTENQTVAYGVPLAPDVAHPEYRPDLQSTAVTGWAQQDQPYQAPTGPIPSGGTALCPAGSATATASGDLRDCTITYLDMNGRAVNTATYSGTLAAGWHVTTAEYDSNGRTLRTLTAANREEALNPTGAAGMALGLPADTAAGALQLSTVNQYTVNASDGISDLSDTFGPYHQIALPDGSLTLARSHTHLTYDTGGEPRHPTGGALHLVLTSTTGASRSTDPVPGLSGTPSTSTDADQRTTTYQYDNGADSLNWQFEIPWQTITDPSGLKITQTTKVDGTGWVIESRMPNNTTGGGAGTTLSSYYNATTGSTDPQCNNNQQLDGLLCLTRPANLNPTGGAPGLITKKYSYDAMLRPTAVTETPSGDTTHPRTSRALYGFNSTVTSNISSNPWASSMTQTTTTGGLGTALPAQSLTYQASTGLLSSVSDGNTADSSSYDDFGRRTSYTENTTAPAAQSNLTTTTFDPSSGMVTASSDAHQSRTLSYNTSTEHRWLPTSLSVTINSNPAVTTSWTASYDPNGNPLTQTDSSNTTTSLTRDENNQLAEKNVQRAGTPWFSDAIAPSIHGQWIKHSGPTNAQTYGYDQAGRLNQAADTPTNGTCTTRAYAFDSNSNRALLTSYPADTTASPAGICSATTAMLGQVKSSYDDADRLLTPGTVYDSYGRTTTAPAATVTGGSDLTVTYNSNDLVASQNQGGTTGTTKTYTLDPTQQRLRTSTTSVNGTTTSTTTNHYDDPNGDSPSWISETADASQWTANTTDLLGNLANTTTQTGTTTQQYSNLHGDITATSTPTATTPTFAPSRDEYGNTGGTTRYGWLGSKQRSTDALGSLILMGVRLYNPSIGRFFSVDPVVGGNANPYDYCAGDPINCTDLGGKWSFCGPQCLWNKLMAIRHRVQAAEIGLEAALYVLATGGSCKSISGLRVCSGGWGHNYGRGGTTWGTTYVARVGAQYITPERIRHEKIHVEQWNKYGENFGVMYLLAGSNPCTNKYEIQAGLKDGGYWWC